ncbi:MAG: hypothetical protein ACRYG4_09145 [Janthinobacterium lividum]
MAERFNPDHFTGLVALPLQAIYEADSHDATDPTSPNWSGKAMLPMTLDPPSDEPAKPPSLALLLALGGGFGSLMAYGQQRDDEHRKG